MLVPSRSLLRYWRSAEHNNGSSLCLRQLSCGPCVASGHSKWATIKHDKARNDANKGRERTAMAKEIVNSIRFYGPDPGTNNRLVAAIASAKRAGMSKASIETAMLRGQGKSASGAALDTIILEAVLPPVGLIVECETDSKGRTLQELRSMLTRRGAQASPTQYLFEKRGKVILGRVDGPLEVDEILEEALEAGAIDLEEDSEDSGRVIVYTDPSSISGVEKIADEDGMERLSTDIIWFPKEDTMVEADESLTNDVRKLESDLEDYSGVQGIYTNMLPNAEAEIKG